MFMLTHDSALMNMFCDLQRWISKNTKFILDRENNMHNVDEIYVN